MDVGKRSEGGRNTEECHCSAGTRVILRNVFKEGTEMLTVQRCQNLGL